MYIKEFLIKLGFDAKGANRFNSAINIINLTAKKLDDTVRNVSSSMSTALNGVGNNFEKAGGDAEKVSQKISKNQLLLKGVVTSIAAYGSKITSAFKNAIKNAQELYLNKDALFKISKTELSQVDKYQKAMAAADIAVQSVVAKLALNLVPALTKVIDGFLSWLTVNKDLIAYGITKLSQLLSKVIQTIFNTVRFIDRVISSTIGWKNALILLGIAWAIFNKALLFSPIGIVIAGITMLMLLIDDLMTYMDGGKSLFGEYWQPLIDSVKNIMQWFDSLSHSMQMVILTLAGVFTLVLSGSKVLYSVGLIIGNVTKTILFFGKNIISLGKIAIQSFNLIINVVRGLSAVMMANPILAIISAIALAAYLIYQNWDFLVAFFASLWGNITHLFLDAIKNILMYFGMSEEGANNVVNSIISVFSSLGDLLVAPFQFAWETISDLFDIWADDTTSLTDKISASFTSLSSKLIAPFKFAITWIKDKFMGYIDVAKKKITGILSFFGFKADNNEPVDEKFDTASFNAEAAAVSRSVKTVNQGDMTNNIVINTNDTRVGAMQAGDMVREQIVNVHNNTRSALRGV